MDKEEIEIFKIFKDTRIFSKDGNLWRGALWEVSNLGNVRKNGEEYLPFEDGKKYLNFGYNNLLHRAVAELFVPNPEQKKTVDHINRDKHDNRACNLRWATMKEQSANRDNESISKSLIGNKNALGHSPSKEARLKMGAASLGKKHALGCKRSEETKAKLRAAALGHKHSEEPKAKLRTASLGNKNASGRVWVFNPSTEYSATINPSQLTDYLAKGYIRGRKIKK